MQIAAEKVKDPLQNSVSEQRASAFQTHKHTLAAAELQNWHRTWMALEACSTLAMVMKANPRLWPVTLSMIKLTSTAWPAAAPERDAAYQHIPGIKTFHFNLMHPRNHLVLLMVAFLPWEAS